MDENILEGSNPVAPVPEQIFIPVSHETLRKMTGWATFKAVMDIIAGALSCLGIITAAFGVPLIIAGVRLLGAVDEFKRYMASNDPSKISAALDSMEGFFRLTGISIIIKMFFVAILIILYIALIAYVIANPDFLNNLTRPGGFSF